MERFGARRCTVDTGDLISVSNEEQLLVSHWISNILARGKWDIYRIAGGVSSNVWLARDGDAAYVLKQALHRLRVRQCWEAPLARATFERRWLALAAELDPGMVAPTLHFDPALPLLVTAYLAPERFPVWQRLLFAGTANCAQAAAVGAALAGLHAHTAGKAQYRQRFDAAPVLWATRIDPYFFATAERHPRLATRLQALGRSVLREARAVIHGDASPKNILLGPAGPVFLDAECACYADPAFDLAFCLNHLLLKGFALPALRTPLAAQAGALVDAYRSGVRWESADAVLGRAALLLPALMLARIDGKVPLAYLSAPALQQTVRKIALHHLEAGTGALERLLESVVDASRPPIETAQENADDDDA